MLYAYCRVSTERQNLQRQVENIARADGGAYAGARFYSDKFTGASLDRPEWSKLYRRLKKGDMIIFDSVSRLSRDAESGAALYQELYEKGIELKFLNEPLCDTENFRASEEQAARIPLTGDEIADVYVEATRRVLMILARRQVKIAFEQAEKERMDTCKRVKDGMRAKKVEAAAKGETVTYGLRKGTKLTTKKSIAAKEIIARHSKTFGGSLGDRECMALCGCCRNSFYKYKRELLEELNGS